MGKNINELLITELENLEDDLETRRSATTFLKSNIKQLDSKYLQLFLSRAYEINDLGSPSGECILFLLEVLSRAHGCNIVPHLDKIMNIITKTLSSSLGSFTLHQSSSKVGPSILRYGIEPLMSEDEKSRIVSSICKPLSDLLMGSQESAASGSAICLQALVEADNWKFASDSLVNEVCLKVSSALEESQTQTTNHMGLVMALSQHNPLVIDAYSRLLIVSGIQILTCEANDKLNSQKKLSAVKMINMLMKCVDSRSISSEIDNVIDVMEKFQSDCTTPFLSGAASEACQTAKIVKQRLEPLMSSSPFVNSDSRSNPNSNSSRRSNAGEGSSLSHGQALSNCKFGMEHSRRSWRNRLFENGCSESGSSGNNLLVNSAIRETLEIENSESLSGSMRGSTQSPRPESDDDDYVNIYSTPRNLSNHIRSSSPRNLSNYMRSSQTEDQERRHSRTIRSPRSVQHEQIDIMEPNGNQTPEEEIEGEDNDDVQMPKVNKRRCGKTLIFFSSCIVVGFVAFVLSNLWIDDDGWVVPT